MWKVWCLLLLPFVLIVGIICPSGELLRQRREQVHNYTPQSPRVTQYMDTSSDEPVTRTHLRLQPNQDFNQQSHLLLQHQQQHQQQQQHQPIEPEQPKKKENIDDTLANIFKLGPGKGLVIFNNPTETRTTAPTTSRTYVQDFVFPDQPIMSSTNNDQCADPSERGKLFCTKVQNYPSAAQLEMILTKANSRYDAFFNDDFTLTPVNITQRIDKDLDEEFFCKSEVKTIYPKLGLRGNTWELIVNNEIKRQPVRVEECSNPDASCDKLVSDALPLRYTTRCAQQYTYFPLVAILSNGTVVREHFKMPSCCKCAFKLKT